MSSCDFAPVRFYCKRAKNKQATYGVLDCRADYLKTDNEDRIQTCDNLAIDL